MRKKRGEESKNMKRIKARKFFKEKMQTRVFIGWGRKRLGAAGGLHTISSPLGKSSFLYTHENIHDGASSVNF
jgi:hypothetical protein